MDFFQPFFKNIFIPVDLKKKKEAESEIRKEDSRCRIIKHQHVLLQVKRGI